MDKLVTSDVGSEDISIHPIFESTVLAFFGTLGGNTSGLGFDGANLLSCARTSSKVYKHVLVTGVEADNFVPPAIPNGMSWNDTGVLLCSNINDTVYQLDGFSNSVLDSFSIAGSSNPSGLAWDGINVINCDATKDSITQRNGFGSGILVTFASPGNTPTGITFLAPDLYSVDTISDTVYRHDGISSSILDSWTPGISALEGLTAIPDDAVLPQIVFFM